ncbi:MAG: leucyl/phenylalanyl-tRNA--protein transferase [Prevotellaceae bacterium]|nr:leucyl/phenylalanyl-tRNA--protein transferase [Prevotellaceae bacterium]
MVWRLTDDPTLFPDPHYGEDDGLVAVGGDLSPERLANAYSNGFFPWYGFKESDDIMWFCPLDRFVIFPKEIHISHSMRQLINRETYRVSINNDFDQVIESCGKANGRYNQVGAWLGDDIIKAYKEMHRLHLAASVEVWDDEENLVGGLYGINIGKNFFGESMFSLVPSASKLALIALARTLEPLGGIIDCQLETAHLKSMGGRHISYEEYMKYLRIKNED